MIGFFLEGKHFVWKGEEQNPSPEEEQADKQLSQSHLQHCPLAELAQPFGLVLLVLFLQSSPKTERFHL